MFGVTLKTMFQSNLKFYLKDIITIALWATDTFEISEDLELWQTIDTDWEEVSLVLKNRTQIERFIVTISSWVVTIVKRGLTQSSTETESEGLRKQWSDGDLWYITALAFDYFNKDGDNTISWNNTFSGNNTFSWTDTINNIVLSGDTTTPWFKAKNFTTAQRLALTPSNWNIVYDTDDGIHYQYIGWAWTDFASWSVVNASSTVAGKVEIWTQTEVDTPTDTGWTGATNVIIPSTFQQGITNRISTEAQAKAWTNDTQIMTPSKTKLAFDYNLLPFGDWSDWDVVINSGTTTLTRDMYYNNLTVTNPWILNPNWYKVFVLWTFSWNGTIETSPNNWWDWSWWTAWTWWAKLNEGTLWTLYAWINWATGKTWLWNGLSTTGNTIADSIFAWNNNKWGDGWNTSFPNTGWTGWQNTITKSYLSDKSIIDNHIYNTIWYTSTIATKMLWGWVGGASGAVDNVWTSGWGWGWGSSWAIIFISAITFNFTGTINANWGNGWNAWASSATANNGQVTAWSWGWWAWSGWIIYIIAYTLTNTWTINALGWTWGNGWNAAEVTASDNAQGWDGWDGWHGWYCVLQYMSIDTLWTITLTWWTGWTAWTWVWGWASWTAWTTWSDGALTQIIF